MTCMSDQACRCGVGQSPNSVVWTSSYPVMSVCLVLYKSLRVKTSLSIVLYGCQVCMHAWKANFIYYACKHNIIVHASLYYACIWCTIFSCLFLHDTSLDCYFHTLK